MNCTCPKWKYKELKTTCACGGIAYYQKIDKIDDKYNKKAILEKLKAELQTKRADMVCLKMDIRDLENEMKDEEDKCKILKVESVSFPNCDCSSCN